jgi:chorismate synthase
MPTPDTSVADYIIRDLETFEEAMEVRRIQRTIWQFDDPDIGLYPPLLLVARHNGGTVLGAFDPAGHMVGYVFGFLGREPGGPLKICSMNMGVLPEWRGRDIAKALKLAQRERALAAGLALITWTFDPLESRNAHLNLHTLGTFSRRYQANMYGQHFGALNAGLPSDRLLAEWWLDGPPAELCPSDATVEPGPPPAPVFEVAAGRVVARHEDLAAPRLWLEVPADIQSLKRTDIALALDWRLQVRQAFAAYFARGYVAGDFNIIRGAETRAGYLLTRGRETVAAGPIERARLTDAP